MKIKYSILFLLIASLFSCVKNENTAGKKQMPNVVFIYADDLGYGDLSCYGSDSIYTPNIDKLANKGVRFTDFYSTSPICSPSRTGLLTGRYPIRNGIGPVFFPNSKGGLDASVFTMVDMFKEKGYATGCIGKWHLGHQENYLPLKHGFDYYFGLLLSNDMEWPRPWQPKFKSKNPLALYRNQTIIDQPVYQPTLSQRYATEAINFIGRNHENPFFLYLPHTFPHEPLYVSAEFKNSSKYGLYGDVVQELDKSVGDVIQALEDYGLMDNTIVVFSSDNGARQVPQRWGNLEPTGSNGILKGRKQTTFEGGIRVPTIAWGKGTFEGGRVDSIPYIMCDWLPTFAAQIDFVLPEDIVFDGEDIVTMKTESNRDFYFYREDKLNAIRSGKWKLKLANPNKIRREPMPHDTDELYNLEEDPGERTDLAEKHPQLVEKLKLKIKTFEESLEPLPPIQK